MCLRRSGRWCSTEHGGCSWRLCLKKLLILSSFVLSALPIVAQSGAQSGSWGSRGISRQFVISGHFLVAADGRGAAVYDIANGTPRRVSVAQSDEESLGVASIGTNEVALLTRAGIGRYLLNADGSLAEEFFLPQRGFSIIAGDGEHAAAGDSMGVTIFAPTDAGLEPVGRIAVMGAINALAMRNGVVYVAVDRAGISSYSLSGSALSVIAVNARDLAFSGDTLYAAGGSDGLLAIDASDPSALRVVSRTDSGEINFSKVAASETRVYAVNGWHDIHVYSAGLNPEPQTIIDEPADTLAAAGDRLFVSGSYIDQWGSSSYTGTQVRAFDTTTAVRVLGNASELAGPVSGVATDGTLAYVLDLPYFRVIDVSTTSTPKEIGTLPLSILADRVKVQSTKVVLYGRGDVDIIDVKNPYVPRLIGTYHSGGRPPSTAAFAGENIIEGNPASGFHVVDFTHFAEPSYIAGIKGHYWEVIGHEESAYIFDQTFVRIVDLATRGEANIVKNIAIGVVEADFAPATGNHPDLLIIHGLDGLHLFSVADRLNPTELGFIALPQNGIIGAAGDKVWFATPGSLQTIDISDPAHPRIADDTPSVVAPMQLAAANGKVVVADKYSLRVFGPDTAPPAAPPLTRRRAAAP